IIIPCILSENNEKMAIIEEIAENIGLIFQLADDIIDFKEGDDGLTFVSVDGGKEAKRLIEELDAKVATALDTFGESGAALKEYAAALSRRTV
ncbi:MAG: hypothetical protein WC292_05340, partial [Clostridia bacterium]